MRDYPEIPYSLTDGCHFLGGARTYPCAQSIFYLLAVIPTHTPHARHFITNCALSAPVKTNSLVSLFTATLPASRRRALQAGHLSFGISRSARYVAAFPCFFACNTISFLYNLFSTALAHAIQSEGKRRASSPCRTNRICLCETTCLAYIIAPFPTIVNRFFKKISSTVGKAKKHRIHAVLFSVNLWG